jgi:hypothetical protein
MLACRGLNNGACNDRGARAIQRPSGTARSSESLPVIKKALAVAGRRSPAPVIISGEDRDAIKPGLSREAEAKIERFEAASQRAEMRLGTFRLR